MALLRSLSWWPKTGRHLLWLGPIDLGSSTEETMLSNMGNCLISTRRTRPDNEPNWPPCWVRHDALRWCVPTLLALLLLLSKLLSCPLHLPPLLFPPSRCCQRPRNTKLCKYTSEITLALLLPPSHTHTHSLTQSLTHRFRNSTVGWKSCCFVIHAHPRQPFFTQLSFSSLTQNHCLTLLPTTAAYLLNIPHSGISASFCIYKTPLYHKLK